WAAALTTLLALVAATPGTALASQGAEDMVIEAITSIWGDAAGDGGDLSVRLANAPPGPIERVTRIAFDPATGRFSAIVVANGGLHRVVGIARTEIEVPVPARRIAAGEAISPDDL